MAIFNFYSRPLMKNLPVLPLVIAGALAFIVLSKKTAANLLNFAINSVTPTLNGINLIVTVNVLISNPSNQSFTINNISGSLLINGQVYGTVSNYSAVTLNPGSQTNYPVTITTSVLADGLALYNILNTSSSNGLTIGLSGTASVSGVTIPVTASYKLI